MARRSPYGIHPETKTGALAPLSQAAQVAAENLLNKVIDKLEAGDSEAADRLISRAVAIPFDEHQENWPGPMMADQMLFELLSDVAEEWADAQEHPEDYESVEWLHDEVAKVVDELDSREGSILRITVETMVDDAPILGIHPREARGLAAVVRALPDPDLVTRGLNLPRDAGADRREEIIRLHLGVFVRVMDVLNSDEDIPPDSEGYARR
ncbi:MAG: hypothetical protein ACK40Z_12130 [Dietzia sp.]